jgi:hypothetical protein
MPHTVTLIDRLRVERLVWELSQRLGELPRHKRVGYCREVRQNVLAAAAEAGAAEALRGVGSARTLARDYLTAEYGDGPRTHWVLAAFAAAGIAVLVMLVMGQENVTGEGAIRAVAPHATGTFTVPGITWLQHATVYTFNNGQATLSGGDWTPLFYALWAAAVILAGRLWRVRLRRRPASRPGHSPA